ncbi:MAG: hypothetical protein ACKVJU_23420 [Verrucomicrobiales bacterium]
MTEEKLEGLMGSYLDPDLTDAEAKDLLAEFEASPKTKVWFVHRVSMSNLIGGLNPNDKLATNVIRTIRQGTEILDVELASVDGDLPQAAVSKPVFE